MTLYSPLFVQKTGADADIAFPATNYRLGLITALCQNPGVIDPYAGADFAVTQRAAGANMSVDVAPGAAVILGSDVANQGSYLCTSDAIVNVVTPAAPGTGTRVHRVVAQVRDKLSNGAYTTYDWVLSLLADVGSGTPATPASALSLATVSVSAGQSSVTNANITSTRLWARGVLSTTGTFAGFGPDWAQPDANRPPFYRLTADGFVHLYGWLQRVSSPFTATGGTFYDLASGIPSYACPSSNHDCIAVANMGWAHILVQASGVIRFRMFATTVINVNDWISLDGISYKI